MIAILGCINNCYLLIAPAHSTVFDQFELVSLYSLGDVVKSLKPTNCPLDIVPAKVLKIVFNTENNDSKEGKVNSF